MSVGGGGKGGNTGTNQREDEGDSRDGGQSIMSDEQYKEENPKVMKATLQLKNALFLNEENGGGAATLSVPEERKILKAPHFSQKREVANYKNYVNTFTINNAHSD